MAEVTPIIPERLNAQDQQFLESADISEILTAHNNTFNNVKNTIASNQSPDANSILYLIATTSLLIDGSVDHKNGSLELSNAEEIDNAISEIQAFVETNQQSLIGLIRGEISIEDLETLSNNFETYQQALANNVVFNPDLNFYIPDQVQDTNRDILVAKDFAAVHQVLKDIHSNNDYNEENIAFIYAANGLNQSNADLALNYMVEAPEDDPRYDLGNLLNTLNGAAQSANANFISQLSIEANAFAAQFSVESRHAAKLQELLNADMSDDSDVRKLYRVTLSNNIPQNTRDAIAEHIKNSDIIIDDKRIFKGANTGYNRKIDIVRYDQYKAETENLMAAIAGGGEGVDGARQDLIERLQDNDFIDFTKRAFGGVDQDDIAILTIDLLTDSLSSENENNAFEAAAELLSLRDEYADNTTIHSILEDVFLRFQIEPNYANDIGLPNAPKPQSLTEAMTAILAAMNTTPANPNSPNGNSGADNENGNEAEAEAEAENESGNEAEAEAGNESGNEANNESENEADTPSTDNIENPQSGPSEPTPQQVGEAVGIIADGDVPSLHEFIATLEDDNIDIANLIASVGIYGLSHAPSPDMIEALLSLMLDHLDTGSLEYIRDTLADDNRTDLVTSLNTLINTGEVQYSAPTPQSPPVPEPENTVHIAVSGDYLWKIADQYYGDQIAARAAELYGSGSNRFPTLEDAKKYVHANAVEGLARANGKMEGTDANDVQIGELIVVPADPFSNKNVLDWKALHAETQANLARLNASTASSSPSSITARFGDASRSVVVEQNDTLSKIVRDFNDAHGTNHSWQDVAAANNLENPNLIRPGQVIKIGM